jgi:hypothetical protein
MEPQEIIDILSKAFAPYRCVAELWDYNERVRIRLYNKDNSQIATFPNVVDIKTTQDLTSIIASIKAEIINRGFTFD